MQISLNEYALLWQKKNCKIEFPNVAHSQTARIEPAPQSAEPCKPVKKHILRPASRRCNATRRPQKQWRVTLVCGLSKDGINHDKTYFTTMAKHCSSAKLSTSARITWGHMRSQRCAPSDLREEKITRLRSCTRTKSTVSRPPRGATAGGGANNDGRFATAVNMNGYHRAGVRFIAKTIRKASIAVMKTVSWRPRFALIALVCCFHSASVKQPRRIMKYFQLNAY